MGSTSYLNRLDDTKAMALAELAIPGPTEMLSLRQSLAHQGVRPSDGYARLRLA